MSRCLGVLFVCFRLFAEDAKTPATPAEPAPSRAAEESAQNANMLGKTNAEAGESRRNENVQFNLIDNNGLKDLNIRMGTTATIVNEFRPELHYFGVEFGNKPAAVLHVPAVKKAPAIHGMIYATHGNSIFSARSFFQVGGVQPARENHYGFNVGAPLWRGAFLLVDG